MHARIFICRSLGGFGGVDFAALVIAPRAQKKKLHRVQSNQGDAQESKQSGVRGTHRVVTGGDGGFEEFLTSIENQVRGEQRGPLTGETNAYPYLVFSFGKGFFSKFC